MPEVPSVNVDRKAICPRSLRACREVRTSLTVRPSRAFAIADDSVGGEIWPGEKHIIAAGHNAAEHHAGLAVDRRPAEHADRRIGGDGRDHEPRRADVGGVDARAAGVEVGQERDLHRLGQDAWCVDGQSGSKPLKIPAVVAKSRITPPLATCTPVVPYVPTQATWPSTALIDGPSLESPEVPVTTSV